MKASEAQRMTEDALVEIDAAQRERVKPVLDQVYALIRCAAKEGRSHAIVEFAYVDSVIRVIRNPHDAVDATQEEKYLVVKILKKDGYTVRTRDRESEITVSWEIA